MSQKHISFCIPTNGLKTIKTNYSIRSILDSIEHNDVSFSYDIKVCGSKIESDLKYKYIDMCFEARTGYVSRLRDRLFKESIDSYLIVYLDDDFIFPRTWAKNFDNFLSNDYDFFSNRILNADNSRYWDRAIAVINQDQHPNVGLVSYDIPSNHPLLYQTGGIMCIKPSVLEKEPWNTSLKWDQFEDLELSTRIKQNLNIEINFDIMNYVWHWDCNYTLIGSSVVKEANICVESAELSRRILEL
tara:strand:- start:2907 stop:3638 length:732 start_codon:yes stop_codon:yes gene_type:complete